MKMPNFAYELELTEKARRGEFNHLFGTPTTLPTLSTFQPFMLEPEWYPRGVTHSLRWAYVEKVGFHIITKELIEGLLPYLRDKTRIVEVMAGTGFLSAALQHRGIKIEPSDNFAWHKTKKWETPHTKITDLDARLAAIHADCVIMCWPYMDNTALEVAKAMPSGSTLIHQGEPSGGCTGSYEFYELVGEKRILKKVHLQFTGIHDDWMIWVKP